MSPRADRLKLVELVIVLAAAATGCIPEYAVQQVHMSLAIEDEASRTIDITVRRRNNTASLPVHARKGPICAVRVKCGALVSPRDGRLLRGQSTSDAWVDWVRADRTHRWKATTYGLHISEDGNSTVVHANLMELPVRDRGSWIDLTIPRDVTQAQVAVQGARPACPSADSGNLPQ